MIEIMRRLAIELFVAYRDGNTKRIEVLERVIDGLTQLWPKEVEAVIAELEALPDGHTAGDTNQV